MRRLLIGLIVWACACFVAYRYGSIWDLRTHPVAQVTVEDGGRSTTGALSREWDGRWVLRLSDTATYYVDIDAVTLSMPRRASPDPIAGHWREWLPVLSVCCLYLAYLGVSLWRQLSRDTSRASINWA